MLSSSHAELQPTAANPQGLSGMTVKGVLFAESYQMPPKSFDNLKHRAAQRGIILLRRSGAGIVQAALQRTRPAVLRV